MAHIATFWLAQGAYSAHHRELDPLAIKVSMTVSASDHTIDHKATTRILTALARPLLDPTLRAHEEPVHVEASQGSAHHCLATPPTGTTRHRLAQARVVTHVEGRRRSSWQRCPHPSRRLPSCVKNTQRQPLSAVIIEPSAVCSAMTHAMQGSPLSDTKTSAVKCAGNNPACTPHAKTETMIP